MECKLQCRCCLLRPPDKDMSTVYMRLGQTEIYSEMLKECFEIHLNLGSEMGGSGICEICVGRLRDACEFKHQVQYCQNVFKVQQANTSGVKEETPVVKEEVIEVEVEHIMESTDFKKELPDCMFDDEDDRKLAELLGLKGDIKRRVKRGAERSVKRSVARRVQRRRKPESDGKKVTKISFKPLPDGHSVNLKPCLLSEKHLHNINHILKHSNCTPFINKTLTGFICGYCKETYPGADELRHHKNTTHKHDGFGHGAKDKSDWCVKVDITDLKCNTCEARLDLIQDLKEHLTKEHGVEFYLDVFDNILEFKLSGSSELFNCALCNSSYETFKMLLQHMNGHYRNFICEVCDQGFINNHRLKNHRRTHESGEFPCAFCDKIFTNRVRKFCHEKYAHRASARYTTNCPHCDETFNSYYQRNRHMAAEHNTFAANYKCNICDKAFILKATLSSHIKRVHLMERNHICAECGMGFFKKKALNEHMTKHSGERVFKCSVCQKAYARKYTLREHMRIHDNDRRFKCSVCDMTFVQKCSMKSHMLSNHGLTLTEFENGADADADQCILRTLLQK